MNTIQNGEDSDLGCFPLKYMAMSLSHITGAEKVEKLSTLEFRFFRCPKTVEEIQLINKFMQAWFQYLHKSDRERKPLEYIDPESVKSCKDYSADETRDMTISYLKKLELDPNEYQCFLSDVHDQEVTT